MLYCHLPCLQAVCESLAPVLNRRLTRIEKGVKELISLLLVTKAETLNLSSTSKSNMVRPSHSRRGSVLAVQFSLNPGEKAALKRKQQREELQQEAQYLYDYLYQKLLNSLVHATRTNLDTLRKALVPPSAVNYGEASDDRMDRQPVFKLQVMLAIPSIVVKPGLEHVQTTVIEAVQTMLAVHKKVLQWGPPEAAEPPAPSMPHILAVASQQPSVAAEKKAEPGNFHKLVSENKDVAKLTTALSSVITAAKKTVLESFDHFNSYQDLWVTEQEPHLQEFMDGDPLLGDFEAKIRHYEQVEAQVMEETDQLRVGAFSLDTG